jgi:hypothetical protein
MIDILLVILFCYQLNRMSRERGISSTPYVLNYVAAFFVMMAVLLYTFFSIYGVEGLKDEQSLKAMMMFEPFAIMFEVFVFIYFRKRIQKMPIRTGDDNDFTPPPPPPSPFGKNKKDLSYFR